MMFDVVYESAQANWGAYVPSLDGVGVTAPSKEAARDLIRGAIALHVNLPEREVELREFDVCVERSDTGYVAFLVPHVAGCWSEGVSAIEAQECLADRIENGCLPVENANLQLYASGGMQLHLQSRSGIPA